MDVALVLQLEVLPNLWPSMLNGGKRGMSKHQDGWGLRVVPKKVPFMEMHGHTYIKAVAMVYWRRIF